MKKLLLILLALIVSQSYAQTRDPIKHMSTTLGSSARYEVIQSTLAARWTFRLDRVCGNVSQMVTTKNEGMSFENMLILGLPKCNPDGKVRYQLFTSGIAARHTFLMNTDTGKTWQIQSSKDKEGNEFSVWIPFEE
jgi:hypothetical protein